MDDNIYLDEEFDEDEDDAFWAAFGEVVDKERELFNKAKSKMSIVDPLKLKTFKDKVKAITRIVKEENSGAEIEYNLGLDGDGFWLDTSNPSVTITAYIVDIGQKNMKEWLDILQDSVSFCSSPNNTGDKIKIHIAFSPIKSHYIDTETASAIKEYYADLGFNRGNDDEGV